MPETELVLRGILAGMALLSLFLAGSFFGSIWPERGWPTRVVIVGLGAVLTYVFAGQIKAFNLRIPFDAYSWLGVCAYTILLTGMVWHLGTRRGR